MADTRNPCGLAPADGATAQYKKSYWNTIKKIQEGKITPGEEADKLYEGKMEKFLDGSSNAGGTAEALSDAGVVSQDYTTSYETSHKTYQCLINGGSTAKKPEKKKDENQKPQKEEHKKEEKKQEASAATGTEPKPPVVPAGLDSQCGTVTTKNPNNNEYDVTDTCTGTTTTYRFSFGSLPDVKIKQSPDPNGEAPNGR